MPYPFADIGSKIDRAEQHVKDFRAALQGFMRANPYKIARQANSEAGEIVYRVLKADSVPAPIVAIAGDALQNLRTALDYLACALVRANKLQPSDNTCFPILKGDINSDVYKSTFDGKVKGMRDDAIEKIKSLKPYKGGDGDLWRLHALNIIDKHRLLITAGASFSRLSTEPLKKKIPFDAEALSQALSENLVLIPDTFPLYKGQEIVLKPTRPESHEDVQSLIEVAVNEPEAGEPIALIAVLRQCFRRVERIAFDFVPFLYKS